MMHDPYGGGGGEGDGQAVYVEPQRTSVMAILSLVCSLICCIPGLGVLGALLGIGSLVGIGGSRGRVGGKGLAIAGIVLGILVTVLWVGAYMAIVSGVAMYTGWVNTVMTDIEDGDWDAVRAQLDPPVDAVSDAQFEAFRALYQAEYGSFQGVPEGWDWWTNFMDPNVGPYMNMYQGQPGIMPTPGTFDSGPALIVLQIDPGSQSQTPKFTNVIIVLPDGSEVNLEDISEGDAP